jgi:uncharacterized protein with NRDE domain
MCLILFAHRAHPAYPLVVAANRDEWFRRSTAPAGFWPDAPDVLAGRDLEQRGHVAGRHAERAFRRAHELSRSGSEPSDAPLSRRAL